MRNKRAAAVILALCMILALMPTTAVAATTANFDVTGSDSIVNGVFTVTNKGTAAISIAGVSYTGTESAFRNIDITAEIVVTLNANTGYTGSLVVDGNAISEGYCQRSEQTAVYTFNLGNLGLTAGNGKNIQIDFSDNTPLPPEPPQPPTADVAIPENSILVGLSDNLGNSMSYDAFHDGAMFGVTIQYSYDGTVWNELSNHTSDENCIQAFDSSVNSGTYTYAFTNADTVYIRVTAVTGTGGTIQSKALAGYDDGKTIWPGGITINQSYTLNKKDGSVYDLEYNNGIYTVIWSYEASAQPDLRVENGTVNITKIDGVDASSLSDPAHGIGNTESGGFWRIRAGAVVEVELKPDYGYQFLSGGFNGATMVSGGETSTFTFTMAATPLHFNALFQKVDNTVNAESKKVQTGSIEISDQEIDSGTVELSVKDISLTSDQITNFETAASGYNISSFLNINLDQVLYKGSAGDVWRNELKELNKPAMVTLQLEEGVDGNEIVIVHEKHDGSYEIIPTTYDPVTRTISFETASFSNYAIASKTAAQGKVTTGTNSSTKSPKTGDNSHMGGWLVFLFVSCGAFGMLGILREKRKHS